VFDEMEMLRGDPELQRLLHHYAVAGETDRETWRERLMVMEGVEPRDVVKLHGLLIAFGWVEQNTGNTSVAGVGSLIGCYRITLDGLRASKAAGQGAVEPMVEGAEEAPEPKRREWRKGKPGKSRKVVEPQPEEIPCAVGETRIPNAA
jgi:hypothetical protein